MEIYLYTEPGCSACVEAEHFLVSRGVLFKKRDVRAHEEFRRILTDDLDSCTLPTLVAGDTIIVGFDREEYQRLPLRTTVKKRK
jgi:glutaredoxin